MVALLLQAICEAICARRIILPRPASQHTPSHHLPPPHAPSYHGRVMTLPVVEAAMEDLRLAHRELLRVVDSLSDADWDRYVPYGEWTVKDLGAHCIGDMSPPGAAWPPAPPREAPPQILSSCHDAMHNAALKLTEEHLPVLAYNVPMGPDYDLHVEDWLWAGYHDRQHADDIRRALQLDWRPGPAPAL